MAQDETTRQWGQNIRLHREVLNHDGHLKRDDEPSMTQKRLGELLDPPVTQSTVARWESGSIEPRRKYKAQLARVLLTDIRILFSMTRSAA